MLSLRDIIFTLTDCEISSLDVQFSHAVIDSRQAVKDSLFIALPGDRVDGHDYVRAAFDNGAIAALIHQPLTEKFNTLDLRSGHFDKEKIDIELPICLRVEDTLTALQTIAIQWRQKNPVKTIGITGSVGKTSTKELTASLLASRFKVLKNPGNRNNEIGLPLTLLELEPHHECAVLEMGFYVPGEIRTLCEIANPQIGVLTNIGTVHAERAGSQEQIARGKAELVESLPSAPQGVAVLNMDDPWVRWMSNRTNAKIFSYGIEQPADLVASNIKSLGLEGITCQIKFQGEKHHIHSPLLGEFSAYTILCATAVALTLGLSWDEIIHTLASTRLDLRMRHFSLKNGAIVLDDSYNASPVSTRAALKLLGGLSGRRVAILGDMLELGPYEKSGHESVGEIAINTTDVLILIGERSKNIADAAIRTGFPSEAIHWFPNTNQATQEIVDMIQGNDVVLVKGSNVMRMDRVLKALEEGV